MGSRDPFAALHALSSHLVPTYEAGGTSVRQGGGDMRFFTIASFGH